MLCPEASPVVNSNRTNSRLALISCRTPTSSANRLQPRTTSWSSSKRARMLRAAASAVPASVASTSTERVIRSSTRVATMPFSASIETLAPRPTEGHSGDS